MIIAGAGKGSAHSLAVDGLVLIVELAVLASVALEARQLWRVRETWKHLRSTPRSSRNRVARQIQRRQPVADDDRWIAESLVRLYADGMRWLPLMLGAFVAFSLTMAWTIAAFMRWTFVVIATAVAVALPGVLWVRQVFRRGAVSS